MLIRQVEPADAAGNAHDAQQSSVPRAAAACPWPGRLQEKREEGSMTNSSTCQQPPPAVAALRQR